jgi:thioredoxin 1
VGPIIEEVAADNAGKVVVGKCDVDKNQAAAAKYGVMSIPTVVLFKGGEEVDRIVGAMDKSAYQGAIDKAL